MDFVVDGKIVVEGIADMSKDTAGMAEDIVGMAEDIVEDIVDILSIVVVDKIVAAD